MAWEKIVSMKEAVKSFIVMEGGTVDMEKSKARFEYQLLRHMADQSGNTELIKECIAAVFADFPGNFLNQQAINSMTIRKMAAKHPDMASPALFGKLSKSVEKVMEDLTGDEGSGKPYGIRKGPAMGHYCRAHQSK